MSDPNIQFCECCNNPLEEWETCAGVCEWCACEEVEKQIKRGEFEQPTKGDTVTMEWQPIDTAPRDGTPILVASTFRTGEGSYGVCLTQRNGYSANRGRPCWRSADGIKMFPGTVTHWMPLPPAPNPKN